MTCVRARAALAVAAAGLLTGCGGGSGTAVDAGTTVGVPAVIEPSIPVPVPPDESTAGSGSSSADHGGHPGSVPAGMLTGNLGVRDQTGNGRTVTVGAAEIDGSPGWVAIRADAQGKPAALLGLARRADGQHDDVVTVALAHPVRTAYYWATLHIDAGIAGRYEYPGPDAMLNAGTIALTRRFLLTVA